MPFPFQSAFDHQKARAEGSIKPKAGMDTEYDDAVADVASSKAALDDYLSKQKQRLGCKVCHMNSIGNFDLNMVMVTVKVAHRFSCKTRLIF